ncbi:NACHT domain-containing protein [Mycena venus]|uniref:NACHT domain-containing protein n=1 Tax=Mycena venus TaxID=2733690 RepID=A0A8H6U503_9AGAR|nr:NACHT domain-containing protein [Mycena venus]
MRPRSHTSPTVNNYFSGGVGGSGGAGGVRGGAGGLGDGPTINYDIDRVRNLTMNNNYLDFQVVRQTAETGIHILHRAVSLEALHNSAESFPQPKCHPETREAMLDDLFTWGVTPDDCRSSVDQRFDPQKHILWLHGPAGAGKSAIMRSLCNRLEVAGRLGGSFFFKRGDSRRGTAKSLFATLAYQLALCIPHLRGPIGESTEKDPSVVGRSPAVQLRQLIVEPCRTLSWAVPTLIIDGLDECQDACVQAEIVRSIGDALRQHSVPLRFVIASRPEPHIRQAFEGSQLADLGTSFSITQSFSDVEKYLQVEFARILDEHRHTMAKVPTLWPSKHIVDFLVTQASGYFIYASTVIKFIDDHNYRPTERLALVLELPTESSDDPFYALDQLYAQILSGVPAHPLLLQILLAFMTFSLNLDAIDDLFELETGDAYLRLRGLHSLLDIPHSATIKVHHASLQEFLYDPRRSGKLCISTPQNRLALAHSVLKMFSRQRLNLTNISWSIIKDGLSFIASLVAPSADLVPLIRDFNPHFLWCRRIPSQYRMAYDLNDYTSIADKTKTFIEWLQKIPFVPADMLELWKDYHFLLFCDMSLAQSEDLPRTESDISVKSWEILKNSPPLIQLFQLRHVLATERQTWAPSLFQTALMADVDWHDMMVALRPLRSLIPESEAASTLLVSIFGHLQGKATSFLVPFNRSAASRDLARAFIRIVKDLTAAPELVLFQYTWQVAMVWNAS